MWGQGQTLLAESAGWAAGDGREEGSPQLRIVLVEAGKWIQQRAVRNIERLVRMDVVGPAGGRGASESGGKHTGDSLTMGWILLGEMLTRDFCVGQGS